MNGITNSHILEHEFDFAEPATLEEAVSLLSQYGDRARVLAGGTDLLVHMKMERSAPEAVVSLRRIPGLDLVRWGEDGALHIGPMATIKALRNAQIVRRYYPALAEACASFSTTQVQTMGTVGGNLCNGSPASDSAPALIGYGAEVVVLGPEGQRTIALESFFKGPGKTALRSGELLVDVVLPGASPSAECRTGEAFLKMSRVAADIAKANCAVVIERSGDCIHACRLAFGSVAPWPMRARHAEAALVGQQYSDALVEKAARLAAEEVSPIDDVRSSSWYRRQIVAVMAHDGLVRAWERSFQKDGLPAGAASQAEIGAVPAAREPGMPALRRGEERAITLIVNGTQRNLRVKPNDLLLSVLRDRLELTGSKYGCGIGECGACTVLLDGKPALACLVLAASADGHEVTTVEGLQRADGSLDPLQEAFLEHAAFQCGFCTPGMLMTARSLLNEHPSPTEDEVRDGLKGNLCRCTGYARIVQAVMSCSSEGVRP